MLNRLVEKDKLLLHPLQHNTSHADALIVNEAKGSWLYTEDGRKILDAFAGMWNVNIGYGNEEIAKASYDQILKLSYMSNFSGGTNTKTIELAEKLSDYAYEGLRTTFFTSGGSEANDSAIKTARYYWKRKGKAEKTKFIALKNGFHGFSLAAMSATGLQKFSSMFGPVVPGFLFVSPPTPIRYEGEIKEGESVSEAAAREIEEMILKEGADTIAGFIVEPVQGVGGGYIPPTDYYKLVRSICDKYNVLFISDEIITGFGRTGYKFGLHHWGVKPDILTFAKGVTSGYLPLGGIQITDEINETINSAKMDEAWLHGYTYSGHSTACAVALKNIEILERDGLYENVNIVSRKISERLNKYLKRDDVAEIRELGLLFAIEFVKSTDSLEPDIVKASYIYKECLKKNVRLRALGNNVVIAPPFNFSDSEIEIMMQTLDEVIARV